MKDEGWFGLPPQRLLLRFKTRLLVVLVEWRTVSFRTGRQPLLLADLEATNDLALSRLFMVAVWERNWGALSSATSSVLDGGELGYRRFIRRCSCIHSSRTPSKTASSAEVFFWSLRKAGTVILLVALPFISPWKSPVSAPGTGFGLVAAWELEDDAPPQSTIIPSGKRRWAATAGLD